MLMLTVCRRYPQIQYENVNENYDLYTISFQGETQIACVALGPCKMASYLLVYDLV